MNNHKIAVIGGDGIGPEVVEEGLRVLRHVAALDGSFAFDCTAFPWGCEYYLKTGRMMPEDGMEQLAGFDAIYLGAVGAPGVPDHISLWDLLLKIRKGFDQYINLRPVKLLEGAPCPLKDVKRQDIDMVVVRELDFCIFDSTSPHEYFPSRTGDEIIDIYKAAVVPGTDEKYAARLTDAAGEYKAEVRVATEFLRKAVGHMDAFQRTYLYPLDEDVIEAQKIHLLQAIF